MAQVSDHYDGSAPSYHEQYDPEKIWTNAEYPANYFRLNKVMQILKSRNVASVYDCLLYTSPSPRDLSTSRMPSSA